MNWPFPGTRGNVAPAILEAAAETKRQHAALVDMVQRMTIAFDALAILNADLGPVARARCAELAADARELVRKCINTKG